jgi:spermidine synthase
MTLRAMRKLQPQEHEIASGTRVEARANVSRFTPRILFIAFFVSGFSGLVYQVVWVRLAFASFGIIAPVLSIVVSVFMLGLALGAWAGGQSIKILVQKTGWSALWFYAGTELVIGISAFAVPELFAIGEKMLLSAGAADSTYYLFFSAVALALSILPWCFFMGATFPLMMAFVREQDHRNADSFSFLYVANVLGAMGGTVLSAVVLVELFGFRHTLWLAAAGNWSVAIIAALLALRHGGGFTLAAQETETSSVVRRVSRKHGSKSFILSLLFLTGFTALAMEVIWARAFTPVLQTQVYSFALIVFAYLGATFLGSSIYRRDLRRASVLSVPVLLSVISVVAFLPVIVDDLRFLVRSETIVQWGRVVILLSICPFCAALGYLTPSLIDGYALGDPAEAGRAYAVNVLGCILGPLFASYVLLPWLGERIGLVVLGLPFLLFFVAAMRSLPAWYRWMTGAISTVLIVWSLVYSVDFARFISRNFEGTEIRRDYAASVVSTGSGLDKQLFVNGIGMTRLVPPTKFMAHLPLGLHNDEPESALIICFGMGTSYRSALSWDVETTAVELVPSVRDAFGFYHSDAAELLENPKGKIIIDDGRRYLNRTGQKFDVIVIDPPPPVETTGSSLLYSEEFYARAKAHLKPNGILATWFPNAEGTTAQAILRSLANSFPFVRCFLGIGDFGVHMLASMEPISNLSAEKVAERMPAAAGKDLLEWTSSKNLPSYLDQVLLREIPVESALNPDPRVRITDDRPYNEYFLLRRWTFILRSGHAGEVVPEQKR